MSIIRARWPIQSTSYLIPVDFETLEAAKELGLTTVNCYILLDIETVESLIWDNVPSKFYQLITLIILICWLLREVL